MDGHNNMSILVVSSFSLLQSVFLEHLCSDITVLIFVGHFLTLSVYYMTAQLSNRHSYNPPNHTLMYVSSYPFL